MIKVDKNIPLPADVTGRQKKYPWAELEVGDSFFIPGRTAGTIAGTLTGAKAKWPDRNYTSVTREENGVKGVRMWRVK